MRGRLKSFGRPSADALGGGFWRDEIWELRLQYAQSRRGLRGVETGGAGLDGVDGVLVILARELGLA